MFFSCEEMSEGMEEGVEEVEKIEEGLEDGLEEMDEGALGRLPSAFFADQSKAFERLSLAWYAAVLTRWCMPPWLKCSMLDVKTMK